jgi:hypothetical protein
MIFIFKSQHAEWRILGSWQSCLLPQKRPTQLQFCGNITVEPAKELKETQNGNTERRPLFSWAQRFPSLTCLVWPNSSKNQRPLTCTTICAKIQTWYQTENNFTVIPLLSLRYTLRYFIQISYILPKSKHKGFLRFVFFVVLESKLRVLYTWSTTLPAAHESCSFNKWNARSVLL